MARSEPAARPDRGGRKRPGSGRTAPNERAAGIGREPGRDGGGPPRNRLDRHSRGVIRSWNPVFGTCLAGSAEINFFGPCGRSLSRLRSRQLLGNFPKRNTEWEPPSPVRPRRLDCRLGNSMVAVVTAEGPTVRTSHPPGSPLHGSDHEARLSLALPDCGCKPPARAVRARRCQRGSRRDHRHRDLRPGSSFEDRRTLRDEIAVVSDQPERPARPFPAIAVDSGPS